MADNECPEEMPRLRRRVEKLLELIDSDAPAAIVARMVSLLWNTAWVVCGDELGDVVAADTIKKCRRSHGYCSGCNHEIDPEKTHYPMCDDCMDKMDGIVDLRLRGD